MFNCEHGQRMKQWKNSRVRKSKSDIVIMQTECLDKGKQRYTQPCALCHY